MVHTEERMIQTRFENIVGANLRRIRLNNGLKAADLVRRLQLKGLDINTATYWKIEAGLNNPSVHLLVLAVDILECDFNELFLH